MYIMGKLCYEFHWNGYVEAKVKWMEKWREVQDPEKGVVDYSEGSGHEWKWMVENNRCDIGSREEYFLLIISIFIQIPSHICICYMYM